ncbi:MAG: ParB/RepB/Spo0J family partition protein [Rickettsiales bacterium]
MAKATVPQHLALRQIPPDAIKSNPDNPRLFFRPEEMEELEVSIQKIGIQVPVSVYEKSPGKYILIDGERRTRCARKLNLDTVPALVQKEPSPLQNLLLMSSIHALREQWDYLTIALNLEKIISLYEKENGDKPSESVLSKITGLSRGQIRRCTLLLNIPKRYRKELIDELEKKKTDQVITEDFFLEMEGALRAVNRRFPEYAENIDEIRDTLIDKRRDGIIGAVTDFRKLTKIATSHDNVGETKATVKRTLDKVFNPKNKTSIEEVYNDTVHFAYAEKRIGSQVTAVTKFVDEALGKKHEVMDEQLLSELKGLYLKLKKIFKD